MVLLKEKTFSSSATENTEMKLGVREESAETQDVYSAAYDAICGQS
jgi:hypothetical protein